MLIHLNLVLKSDKSKFDLIFTFSHWKISFPALDITRYAGRKLAGKGSKLKLLNYRTSEGITTDMYLSRTESFFLLAYYVSFVLWVVAETMGLSPILPPLS